MRGLNKLYLRISVIHNKKALRLSSQSFSFKVGDYLIFTRRSSNYLGHE